MKWGGAAWLTEAVKQQYREVWDASLTGGCNGYRARRQASVMASDSDSLRRKESVASASLASALGPPSHRFRSAFGPLLAHAVRMWSACGPVLMRILCKPGSVLVRMRFYEYGARTGDR